MKDDEQVETGPRRPWVTPAMIEEDCAATESGDVTFYEADAATSYSSGTP